MHSIGGLSGQAAGISGSRIARKINGIIVSATRRLRAILLIILSSNLPPP
jgi:hypothetical protein